MKLKLLALVTVTAVGVLFPSVVQALQWVEMGETDEGYVYLDMDSVKRRGSTVQYWEHGVLKRPNENGITSIKRLELLNCTNANYDILREVAYIGGRVESDIKVTWKETRSTVPGSVATICLSGFVGGN